MSRIIILFYFLVNSYLIVAQSGQIDQTFNLLEPSHDQLNSYIRTSCIQPDNKILIGGNFNTCNINGITRLNQNGTIDPTFQTGQGFNGLVNNIALQNDGKILVSGEFNLFDEIPVNKLVRLNSDGSIDNSFSVGTGFNDAISSISIQPDGKIVVCGLFTTVNGINRKYITRLNLDGSIDNTFNTNDNFNNWVYSSTIQSDGKIIVCGWFTAYSSTTLNFIARLNSNGTLDNSFYSAGGFDSFVKKTALQADGKIIAIGYFTSNNGINTNYLARLNSDGSLDQSFNIGTGLNSWASSIFVKNDSEIYIGGYFNSFNNVPTASLILLNNLGSLDINYNTSVLPHFQNGIEAIAINSDNKMIVAGSFKKNPLYNDLPNNYITSLNIDGSYDLGFTPIGTEMESKKVYSICVQPDNKIIVGGDFQKMNGIARKGIARLNSDGSIDPTFDPGTGLIWYARTLAIQPDGKILVGGTFYSYNGSSSNNIIRLLADGSVDPTFNIGNGFDGLVGTSWEKHVNVIKLQSDGKILVAGNFTSFNGIQRSGIARLNQDGTLDNSFNPGSGFNGQYGWFVKSIDIQSDGKILAGGYFSQYNGNTSNFLVRINSDGTMDNSFNMGSGFSDNINLGENRAIQSINIQVDGKILVVGSFNAYNGSTLNNIARLNSDGSLDDSYNHSIIFNNAILTSYLLADGKLMVGGFFDTLSTRGVARLDINGFIDSTFSSGFGFNEPVRTIISQIDNKLLIGGDFNCYDGNPKDGIVRLENALSNIFENNSLHRLQLYPNPTNSILSISGIGNDFVYQIFDLQGKSIMQGANENQIDVESLPSGSYLIGISIDNYEKLYRFVKN